MIATVVAFLAVYGFSVFLYVDNIRLRASLVTALTTPAPVAGAIITAKQGKAKRPEPEPLPIGV